ncbi:MAG: hypothetical protein IOD12_12795 [Silvanigrellales bacterium]|nr:hypothetical protein [Silvanigrellales bacterium]
MGEFQSLSGVRILITGSSGFLGSRLSTALKATGAEVVHFDRKWGLTTLTSHFSSRLHAIFHLGWEFRKRTSPDTSDIPNLVFAEALVECARSAARPPLVVFASTLSVHCKPPTCYGTEKREAERIIASLPEHVILRLGLVFDPAAPAGLAGLVSRLVASIPFVPVLDTGRQVIQPLPVDAFVAACLGLLEQKQLVARIIPLAGPALYFRDFCSQFAGAPQSNIFLPIPSVFLRLLLTLATSAGLALPLDHDNLVGLLRQRAVPSILWRPEAGVMHFRNSPSEIRNGALLDIFFRHLLGERAADRERGLFFAGLTAMNLDQANPSILERIVLACPWMLLALDSPLRLLFPNEPLYGKFYAACAIAETSPLWAGWFLRESDPVLPWLFTLSRGLLREVVLFPIALVLVVALARRRKRALPR